MLSPKEIRNRAIGIATDAHKGQFDKLGEPYILHPMAVMVSISDEDPLLQAVAVLHDVIEDHPKYYDRVMDLFSGYPAHQYALLKLTHRKNDPYKNYVTFVAQDDIARPVKIADVMHNMSRLDRIADEPTRERLTIKYRKALLILMDLEEVEP